jgi:hypothetical protein
MLYIRQQELLRKEKDNLFYKINVEAPVFSGLFYRHQS